MIAVNPLNPENAGALPAGASAVDADKLGGRAPDEYRLTASAGALRAALSQDTEISGTGGTILPLTEVLQVGDYFRVDGESIAVLKPCVAEISAIAYLYTGFVAGSNHFIQINRNGSVFARTIAYVAIVNPYLSAVIPTSTINLAVGDIITLVAYNSSANKLGGLIKAYPSTSYLNISVVS